MKELLEFILENITGSKNFTVSEKEEEGRFSLEIKVDKGLIGLLIGKGGRTIKSIQNLLRVKGRLENKNVFVNIVES